MEHTNPQKDSPETENSTEASDDSLNQKDGLSSLQDALKESEKKYTYLYAEFENYKKRALKERSEMRQFGWEPVARELIGFIDNLRLGLSHAPEATDPGFLEGIRMVYKQVVSTLEKHGVSAIEAIGKPFDPNLHEAVGQAPHEEPEGTVIHEETQGFTFHGRLLRPARVIVSMGPAKEKTEQNS